MESGTLPPPTMLLHTNDSFQQMPSSHSPMNQYSDVYSTKSNVSLNNKTTKRKFDDLVDPTSGEFDSSGAAIKPQKVEQPSTDSERSLSRDENPLSNGSIPQPSLTPSRNGTETSTFSLDGSISNNHNNTNINNNNNNNNTNTGQTSPNQPTISQQTPPPPSLPQQTHVCQSTVSSQSLPTTQNPPPYMPPISPRNQYAGSSDSSFLQTNNQVFVFTTQLANEAAESVLKNEYPNIIEYHKSLPNTTQFLSSLPNNMHPNQISMMGGPMPPNHVPPPLGCHSPRTMQMMMNGPPHHNAHMSNPSVNNGGPPSNWQYPPYHPQQQQPPFGRLTPGAGGLPPPSHLPPPGSLIMNGSSPPPGMRMGGMPTMPGMGQPPLDGSENLTPERATHRKNQLSKIEDLKTKITGGRARNARTKANNSGLNGPGSIPPPGHPDPHSQQMMMMNSPHGVMPPQHHMMGMGGPPPPPHMMPPGMRGHPDGMMLDMNGPPPPHGHMNGPMPPNFPGQYGPGPGGDPYCPIPPPHGQPPTMRDWKKIQIEHLEGKGQVRGQPPPYSSASPSGMTPPLATTSTSGPMGPNGNMNGGKLLSPKMEHSSVPRLYKVGPPEKFHPDSLPSAANKKNSSNIGDVQMTASPHPMDYNEIGMEGEELIITRHLNQSFRTNNGNGSGPLPSSSSSSSSCKDEPMTPSVRSTSTPNNNSNPLSCGKPSTGSTTPSHLSSQGISAVSPRSSKLTGLNSLASPSMASNTNTSGKEDGLDMNGGPRTPTSNMAPPLSSMLQMTNSLQSAGSPYNASNAIASNNSLKASSSIGGNGVLMTNQNMNHMNKPMDHLSQQHMPLPPPHPQQMMQFHHNMNPHPRMGGPPDSMPPHYNPHHGPNGPPQPTHHQMYKMRPPHPSMDQPGMMLGHPSGPMRPPGKGMPMSPADSMQPYPHHLPPPNYGKMGMDPMLGSPMNHPNQHMRYGPMMDDGFGMGPPPQSHHPHHPHMHPHMHQPPGMHPSPMHPNDGRLGPPQSMNNNYAPTSMPIQQLNIQNMGPAGGPGELQSGTIHYHAQSGNGLDCPPPPPPQQQQLLSGPPGSNSNSMFASQQQFNAMTHMPPNDPSYPSQFNDLQPIQSNLGVDSLQSSPYW